MKKYTIYNCLNKKGNREEKVIVLGWTDIDNYLNNKDLKFLSEYKGELKTLQSIDGLFRTGLLEDIKSYNYIHFTLDRNSKKKILIDDFVKEKEDELIKILNKRYNINISNRDELYTNNFSTNQNLKIPQYTPQSNGVNEYNLLKKVVNYYLNQLNLDVLPDTINPREIQNIARFGDTLFSIHLNEAFKLNDIQNDNLRDFLRSNSNMKTVLIKKGFYELSSNFADTHFTGSLFETLYWISYKQKNYNVLNSLFNEATGLELEQEELFYI